MATITFITGETSQAVEAPEGKTIAEIAGQNGISLYGSCHGANTCCQCSRRIAEGIEQLLRKTGEPYTLPSNAAPYVRTCQAVPVGDVTVECDRRARF